MSKNSESESITINEGVTSTADLTENAVYDIESDSEKKDQKEVQKKKKALSKNTISILRTTLRNNIDLTNIADNKANVLLSLNALMLTFLVPLTIPYIEEIKLYNLGIPMIILALTCLVTIYLAVHVLRPGTFKGQDFSIDDHHDVSPFFYGNFQSMSKDQYMQYSDSVMADEHLVKTFLSNDFYHIGLRLAEKMKLIRTAFNIFISGLAISILITIFLLIFQS